MKLRAFAAHIWPRAARFFTGVLLASSCAAALADAVAEQRERALLWRDLQESRAVAQTPAASLPGASLPAPSGQSPDVTRRRMFEEKQWRSLLSRQQMQRFAPASQAGAQSGWNAQTLDRERKADALSADILQRSRSYLSSAPR